MEVKTYEGTLFLESDFNLEIMKSMCINPIEDLYAIYSQEEELFWSNVDGWVSLETASLYTNNEKLNYHPFLPGERSLWVCLYNEP